MSHVRPSVCRSTYGRRRETPAATALPHPRSERARPRRGPLAQPAARAVADLGASGWCCSSGITVLFVTGLLSYAAYNPDLSPVNDKTPDKGLLGFYLFSWPTRPYWLYRVTQGVHVTLGIVLVPVAAGEAVVGHPEAVRAAAGALPRARAWSGCRCCCWSAARCSSSSPECSTSSSTTSSPAPSTRCTSTARGSSSARFVAHVVLRLRTLVRALRGRGLRGAADADLGDADPNRADDTGLVADRPGGAHRLAARGARPGGRRLARAARGDGGPEHRRPAARDRRCSPRAVRIRGRARTASRSTRPPPGVGIRAAGHRARLAAGRARRGRESVSPAPAAATAPAPVGAAHRLRGGLVHRRPAVAGRTAAPTSPALVGLRTTIRREYLSSPRQRHGPFRSVRPARTTRSATRGRCSPSGSTAPTSPPTTAIPRGSSSPAPPACTTPSGSPG